MEKIACYVNGERVLTANEPSFLGRAALFALGGEAVHLDGLQVRSLHSQEADAEIHRAQETLRTDPLQKLATAYTHAALNVTDAMMPARALRRWPPVR